MTTIRLKSKTITLLGTGATPESLTRVIAAYWCSPPNYYAIAGDKIIRTKDGSHVENHRIIFKRGRYRFERVELKGV
jgi:hypothetical protein